MFQWKNVVAVKQKLNKNMMKRRQQQHANNNFNSKTQQSYIVYYQHMFIQILVLQQTGFVEVCVYFSFFPTQKYRKNKLQLYCTRNNCLTTSQALQ
eukprot:UN03958